MQARLFVDLEFNISLTSSGSDATVPADHGYAVYSAISRLLPAVHGDRSLGIHPIHGRAVGGRRLALDDRSRLTFRLPSDRVSDIIELAGAVLDIEGSLLHVGVPSVRALAPAAALRSRLVTIKGMLEDEAFLMAARSQLKQSGVEGDLQLPRRLHATAIEGRPGIPRSPYVRRTIRIRDRVVVGYAVEVGRLSPRDSIALQSIGLGGRRRFGCGIFLPVRPAT